MELKDFIKTAIQEISFGIQEAQEEGKNSWILINPSGVAVTDGGEKYLRHGGLGYLQELEIKVALTVTTGKSNKAGLGVVAGLFTAGGSMTGVEKNSSSKGSFERSEKNPIRLTHNESHSSSGFFITI